MGLLRLLLVVGLIAGCAAVAFRAPWQARLAPEAFLHDLGNAPIWSPPEAPLLGEFEGFEMGAEPPEGTEIVVELKRRGFFGRFCIVIVMLFFTFGVIGTFIQRRPSSSDVVFSLWLSVGMVLGIFASATLGHMGSGREQFPFFSECLLVGFVIGLLIAIKSMTRLPIGAGSDKSSAKEEK